MSVVLPPITQTAIVDQEGHLTPAGLNLFQRIWAGAFGTGGLIDQVPKSGDLKPIAGATVREGWLLCDGASYLIADYAGLYAEIGTTWGSDGPGTFRVPNLKGNFLIGADGSHALGATGGALSRTIAKANLPAYALTVTDPGHTHVVVDPSHTHVVTDPGHTHVVTDPGHTHAITDPGHHHTGGSTATTTNTAGAAAGTSTAANTGDSPTGITINPAVTGVTNVASPTGVTNNTAATGITNSPDTTGVTVASGGSGTALDTTPAFAAVNWLIKT